MSSFEYSVTRYLFKNYDIDKEDAREAVIEHRQMVNKSLKAGSKSDYVGDEIANVMGLKGKDDSDEDE